MPQAATGPPEQTLTEAGPCKSKSGRIITIRVHALRRQFLEVPLIGPFSQIANIVQKSRYLLLAGTMLSTLALPQWSAASDAASARSDQGTIIVAQNDNNDPRKK